jgi:dolichyl-phosphate-mannose-protein mannosyltransferase
MGNPVIWLSSTVAIVLWVVFKGLAVLRWQRGFKDYSNPVFKRFDYDIGMTVLGWAFHYFPFFLMARQLFLHHYFPALYFAIMAICQIYDFICYRVGGIGLKSRPAIGQAIAVAFIAISITAFTMYAPLAYGNTWTKGACEKVKLLDTWDWDCNTFFDTVSGRHSSTRQIKANTLLSMRSTTRTHRLWAKWLPPLPLKRLSFKVPSRLHQCRPQLMQQT